MISKEIRKLMESGATIRAIWELGRQLERVHGAENVADMTLGNPVAPPPRELTAALEATLTKPPPGLHRYTPNAGAPETRERIAEHLDRRGILPGARAGHVVVTAGASAAINVFLRAALDPGDEVIVLAPYFPDYPTHARNHRGEPVIVPTSDDFLPDLGAIERAIGDRTRAIIVNHPNNPSARQYPQRLLHELAELLGRASRRNERAIYLVSDEPYRAIRYTDEPFVSPARLYEHGVIAYSFSKSHSIPGERIGYLALNPACKDAEQVVRAMTLANRILGFTNAPSLWQHVIGHCLDAVVDLAPLKRNRDRLFTALVERGYEVPVADGAFYLFPRTPGGDDDAFVKSAVDNLLLLVPGRAFGLEGHCRMAYCVDDHTIDLALERIPQATSVEP